MSLAAARLAGQRDRSRARWGCRIGGLRRKMGLLPRKAQIDHPVEMAPEAGHGAGDHLLARTGRQGQVPYRPLGDFAEIKFLFIPIAADDQDGALDPTEDLLLIE